MARPLLCYRGLPYDPARAVKPPATPLDHIYRGHHYRAPLRHEPCPSQPGNDFIYRGARYHHAATATLSS